MSDSPQPSLTHVFESLPLSRARAYLSLTFGGLTLLLIGGVLSYASGSPDVHGSVSTYWTVFFTFHALAFAGAALFGAFPRLTSWPVKLGWLVIVLIALAAALAIRSAALVEAGATSTPSTALGSYAVALLPVLVGLWWGGEPAESGQSAPGNGQ
jgi:hypothetical protein